ncbi:MAG: CCA tRNA nucleotidyltransferase [Acetobacteraceae bacterium]|nr:CCA tRNA nucleotidyltransferase [Acetobacteraceae bacterium]
MADEGRPTFRIPPPAFLADPALHAVLAALPGARLVGGCVRDALAGLPVADVDLATPERPEQVTRRLADAGLRAAPTGLDHGTVTAISGGRGFEVTTLRRDVETDGRHARVAWTDDWREDAARRDFTINAMSMRPGGEVFDYFGGVDDLAAGRVRFVGEAARRIAEDYLRVLRFFRFQARYGRGEPDPEAVAAVREGAAGLDQLSPERVWSELKRVLAAPDPSASIALMDALGVLARALPEGTLPARLFALIAAGAPTDPLLRLAALLDGDDAALADRLRLSGEERDRLSALRHGPVPLPSMDDADLRRLLADEPAALLIGRAWLAGGDSPGWAELRARLAALPRPVFPLAGRDALALGAKPGPPVGRALAAVRAWWLAGGCAADRGTCLAELARRLAP